MDFDESQVNDLRGTRKCLKDEMVLMVMPSWKSSQLSTYMNGFILFILGHSILSPLGHPI